MRRLNQTGWITLAAAVFVGCGDAAPAVDTSGTTRSLLSQPRASDVSNPVDPSRLPAGEPTLGVDLLGINMGTPEAPLKIIEFVDYGCGYCRQFQMESFPAVRAEFIETNMVEWKFMPFISGMFGNSPVVTEAAECALDQDVRLFAGLEDRLWAQQSEWKGSNDPLTLVRGWVTGMGGDGPGFDTCMRDHTRLERVTSATALARQLGVRSTPTFWVVGAGPVQGALPLPVFRQLLTELHEQLAAGAE